MADDLRPSATFTDDEFDRMVAAGAFAGMGKVELRGGRICRMNAQHAPHARIKSALFLELQGAVAAAQPGLEVDVEGSVSFGAGFTPVPDLVVWKPSDVAGAIPGADVALIVEVADTTLADDLGAKLQSYARAGLKEYWVVDLAGRVIHQMGGPNVEAEYVHRRVVRFGEGMEAFTLPGVRIKNVLKRWA